MLKNRHVIVGVSGGIAAYKSCELVSLLHQAGAAVQVIMTPNATRFVAPLTFEALSGRPVYTDLWSAGESMAHIAMADRAELVVISPATANTIAKIAAGIADDIITTTVLSAAAPVLLAPAMNTRMYENPATQANLEVLRGRGITVLDSPEGRLACGAVGPGRVMEPADLLKAIEQRLS